MGVFDSLFRFFGVGIVIFVCLDFVVISFVSLGRFVRLLFSFLVLVVFFFSLERVGLVIRREDCFR